MQQPQSRPLLGDSVSSTTSPTARRNNPVAVLTHQQLQQLQQLQAQNTSGQSLTIAVQQTSNNHQDQGNGSTTGNHIVYVNQLNQLNQGTINTSGTGMGLPPATPTFGVGLNMGLPLSLLNTSLTSLTSNVITTSNPLLNLGLPSINTGLTAINPNLNSLNAINSSLSSSIASNSINNSLSNIGQDLNSINSGINRLAALNSTNSNLSGGLTNVNPNLSTNPNTTIHSGVNQQQGINRSINALTSSLNSNTGQFPFQTIQSIQSLAPHIVGSSLAQSAHSGLQQQQQQHSNSNVSNISQISNSGSLTSSSIFTSTPSESIHATTTNLNQSSNLSTNNPHLGTMHSNMSSIVTSNVQHITASNESNMSMNHVVSQPSGFQSQRQYSQGINSTISSSITGTNVVSTMKSMQNIQSQNVSSPGSPFSIPLKSPASNIAPPTPSPSPNRLLLRSPASNSLQSNRNSPSPVASSNNNFSMQMHSPMQSPISVGQIQSPVLSPYPPAKSPHLLGGNNSLNNRSPAPGGSPGPPVVRPNTPILQQGMQVLQIIHGAPQSYQSTPTQLVTRTHLFGNQQIQIAASKPAKQPPQILPKPPNQQASNTQPKPQRTSTTITNQVTQQTQPHLVLAGPQPSPTGATMIPTAQGLLLNQVLPSTGPVIVQQQPGGVQLILRTPTNTQQQTHTAQLTQQQLVRVVTAQGMQLQGLAPTFFAVPNGFQSTASPVIRHSPSPAPSNTNSGNSIVIQNAMVQSPQAQLSQVSSGNNTSNVTCNQNMEQNLLPPPKKKAKKKKKTKRKEESEPRKIDLANIMKISGIGDDDDIFDNELTSNESDISCQIDTITSTAQNSIQSPAQQITTVPSGCSSQSITQVPGQNTTNTTQNSQLVAQLQMPVQNAISGQLRLAVGEDGRIVLHHTPEPNQPEIDQATAQALIRSLTQGGSQNSQIISHLLGQAQTVSSQSTANRQKYVKSSPCAQSTTCITSQQQGQVSSKANNHQKNLNVHQQEGNPVVTDVQKNKNLKTTNLQQPDGFYSKSSYGLCNIQNPRLSNQSQTGNQTSSNLSLQKSSQVRVSNACLSTNVRQNLCKQHNSLKTNQNERIVKTGHQDNLSLQHDSPSPVVYQRNQQHVFEQNLQSSTSNSVLQHHDPLTMNVLQQHSNTITSGEQTGSNDLSHIQQNIMGNLQQQKIFTPTTPHHYENSDDHQQNDPNVLISQQQQQQQKIDNESNTAANNILNNAPKITPEILNALSNLNPNDQLLIANANGQMQVISQQHLQQFLVGQLNMSNNHQAQNQTQKIVIGEADGNNQNLQGVQINTPTSQIIVNSSGGVPTIQNNIQNIVVQAAPSQMPQHIQIQNSNFPSQFIDNLNQQQIRNLGNNNQPKKTKVVKRTKVAVTASQTVPSAQITKTVINSRPSVVTTTNNTTITTTTTTTQPPVQKVDKTSNVMTQSTNTMKTETSHNIVNGPLTQSSSGNNLSVPSNGQMVQRVQTIQLPAQKQQMLKNIQTQIQAILSRKTGNNPNDQAVLNKLHQEQAKILASGKIVSTTTHSVNNRIESNFNSNPVPTAPANPILKSQTAAVETQTHTTTINPPLLSHNSTNPGQHVSNNSTNNYMSNLIVPQNVVSNPPSLQQQTHNKQHKIYQNQGNQQQVLSTPMQILPTSSLQSNAQTSVQTQPQPIIPTQQQSTQSQTDPLDIKSNIQTQSPVKQESPVQVQIGSPAGQGTSPRIPCKGTQHGIQSPVNNVGNQTKPIVVNPPINSSTPRQGVKRPATSPICRQINRCDLLEQQLKIDQNGATNPDVNTPFLSKRDACKRLVRYHCLNEQVLSTKDLAKADEIFEETAKHLLSKFNSMMNKYTYLLLMESMREVRTSELMMIDRTFVAEEQSILNRLREQETRMNEELKKEEKPLVPKVEPGLGDEDKLTLSGISVKQELEEDFTNEDMDCKPVIKPLSCTNQDYDEWVEIQKELGVYPSGADSLKCNRNSGGGNHSASKTERTRANGECRHSNIVASGSELSKDNNSEQGDSSCSMFERHWTSATDLERDLLEDTDSLDGLALHSSSQCPGGAHLTNESGNMNEPDDITAQVQSAIDSILSLKKCPTNMLSSGSSGSSSASQSNESKDTVLDQAVRSILGS